MEDLFLTVRQQVIWIGQATVRQRPHVILNEDSRDGRAEESSTGGDGADGRKKVLIGRILQKVGAGARCERANDIGLIGMHAEDDHARWSIEFLCPSGDVYSAQLWHADVDNQEIGPVLLAESHRLKTVCGFTHNQQASFLEESHQSASHDAVVVSQQHGHAASP
jgi:hypothetical protein